MKTPTKNSQIKPENNNQFGEPLIEIVRAALSYYRFTFDQALERDDYVFEAVLYILELQHRGYQFENVGAAFFAISRRYAIKMAIKEKRRQTTCIDSAPDLWNPPVEPDDSEQIWKLIRHLVKNDQQYEVLEKVYRHDYRPKELVIEYGERIYTWLSRGRTILAANEKMLRILLGQDEGKEKGHN